MSRTAVTLRPAVRDDAPLLAELWAESLRRVDHDEQVADLVRLIEGAEEGATRGWRRADRSATPPRRIMVAELDGALAGAVLLQVGTLSALNLEPVVDVVAPSVFVRCRRRGVGRALMESAVSFAEEHDVDHLGAAASPGSRDANRFLARLALGPHLVQRVAPTVAVRAKLTARRPAASTTSGREVSRVLAARRSMRRAQAGG